MPDITVSKESGAEHGMGCKMKATKILALSLPAGFAVGLLLAVSTAQATIRCVEDQSGATDHDKIQNGINASSRGDVLIFGAECSTARVYAKPKTYVVGEWTGSAVDNIDLKQAVTYLGMGSTIQLADKPAGASWSGWRWARTFVLNEHTSDTQTTAYSYPTVVTGFRFDGNEDNQGVTGEYESKQGGLYVNADDLTTGQQEVRVYDCAFVDHTWGGLTVRHDVDIDMAQIYTENNHHGLQFTGNNWQADVDNLIGKGDDYTLKIERTSPTVGLDLAVTNATIDSDRAAVWGVSKPTTGTSTFSLTNSTLTCSESECVHLSFYDATITLSNLTVSVPDGDISLYVRHMEEDLTVSDSTLGGYVYLVEAHDDTKTITFDDVDWSGTGWATGSGDHAIRTSLDSDRIVSLKNCDLDGSGNEHALYLRGGKGYIDAATIAATTGDVDEVIWQVATSSDPVTVYWRQGETDPGSEYTETTQWCGASPPSGDCSW